MEKENKLTKKELKAKIKTGSVVVAFYSSDFMSSNLSVKTAKEVVSEYKGVDFIEIDVDDKKQATLANHFKIKNFPSFVTFKDGKAIGCITGNKTEVQFNFLISRWLDENKKIDLAKQPKQKSYYQENYLSDKEKTHEDIKLYNDLEVVNKKDFARSMMITVAGVITLLASGGSSLLLVGGAVLAGVGVAASRSPTVRNSGKAAEKMADNWKYIQNQDEEISAQAEKNYDRIEKKYYRGNVANATNPFYKLAIKATQVVAGAAMLVATKGVLPIANIFLLGMAFSVTHDLDDVLNGVKEKINDRRFKKSRDDVADKLMEMFKPGVDLSTVKPLGDRFNTISRTLEKVKKRHAKAEAKEAKAKAKAAKKNNGLKL